MPTGTDIRLQTGTGNANLPPAEDGAILIGVDGSGDFAVARPLINDNGDLLFSEDGTMVVEGEAP